MPNPKQLVRVSFQFLDRSTGRTITLRDRVRANTNLEEALTQLVQNHGGTIERDWHPVFGSWVKNVRVGGFELNEDTLGGIQFYIQGGLPYVHLDDQLVFLKMRDILVQDDMITRLQKDPYTQDLCSGALARNTDFIQTTEVEIFDPNLSSLQFPSLVPSKFQPDSFSSPQSLRLFMLPTDLPAIASTLDALQYDFSNSALLFSSIPSTIAPSPQSPIAISLQDYQFPALQFDKAVKPIIPKQNQPLQRKTTLYLLMRAIESPIAQPNLSKKSLSQPSIPSPIPISTNPVSSQIQKTKQPRHNKKLKTKNKHSKSRRNCTRRRTPRITRRLCQPTTTLRPKHRVPAPLALRIKASIKNPRRTRQESKQKSSLHLPQQTSISNSTRTKSQIASRRSNNPKKIPCPKIKSTFLASKVPSKTRSQASLPTPSPQTIPEALFLPSPISNSPVASSTPTYNSPFIQQPKKRPASPIVPIIRIREKKKSSRKKPAHSLIVPIFPKQKRKSKSKKQASAGRE